MMDRIPELIEEPADLKVWLMNRTECFNALLREFKSAAESGRASDCINIGGIWANFAQVVTSDLGAVYEQAEQDRSDGY